VSRLEGAALESSRIDVSLTYHLMARGDQLQARGVSPYVMTVDRWPWASTVIQDRCRHCNAAMKIQQYHPHLDKSSYKPSESSARRIICYQCRNARTKEFGSTRCAAVARFGRLRRRAVIRRILEIWFIYEGPNRCTNWIIGQCCVCLPCISDKVACPSIRIVCRYRSTTWLEN
jgi:hypothetical protein